VKGEEPPPDCGQNCEQVGRCEILELHPAELGDNVQAHGLFVVVVGALRDQTLERVGEPPLKVCLQSQSAGAEGDTIPNILFMTFVRPISSWAGLCGSKLIRCSIPSSTAVKTKHPFNAPVLRPSFWR
jgi:hypothetical protein